MPRIADCLAALMVGLGANLVREAIVVDASSSDGSAELAQDMGCMVVPMAYSERGRGAQLRAGASRAKGDWLLFLHADTILSPNWAGDAIKHINDAPDKAAYFKLGFDQAGSGAKRVAFLANWRSQVFGLPYGDQGLLISRQLYEQICGYDSIPLMEDVDMVRRLGKARLAMLPSVGVTSGAKFMHGGWWVTPMRNLILLTAYLLGVRPSILAKWYK